jgi:virginiamycin B lyase
MPERTISMSVDLAQRPVVPHIGWRARPLFVLALVVGAAACSRGTGLMQDTGVSTTDNRSLAATQAVVGIPLPTPDSGPTTVSIARSGRIWFTLGGANAIGSMNDDGTDYRQYAIPTPDSAPRIIAAGSDGNMWFSEHSGNKIGRITPEGRITEFDLPTPGSQPRAIALGSDGNIWIGLFAVNKIGRITPSGHMTEFEIPTPDSGPRALAAGPDGNVWFSEFRAGRIGRITPEGRITEFDLPRPNSGPGDMTTGADGNIWFIELSGLMDGLRPDGDRVGRITMDGVVTEFAMPAQSASAINIAVGPDRNIWYTRGATLGRVTPQGDITEFPIAAGPARAIGISAGSDRQPPERIVDRLWFTDPVNNRIAYLVFAPGDLRR